MGRKVKDSSGVGRGLALILILIELCAAFYVGMVVLDKFGSGVITAMKFAPIAAGFVGVLTYILLHVIPHIRWLMMGAMVLLWAFAAYAIGLVVIGEAQEGLVWVSHKGPYIAAAIAALFRAFMYRQA